MKDILNFLSDLKNNNNREWYHLNKERYKNAREIFLGEIQQIIQDLQMNDPEISDVQAKDAVFRIFRDIRFSTDKTPYKTHFAAYIAKGGRKKGDAGYYVHLSDDEFFVGGGVHSPGKDELIAIRREILYQPELYISIIDERIKMGYKLFEEDKLKNGPKDFPKDSPHLELIKYKHFLLSKDLAQEDVLSGNFSRIVTGHFEELIPFVHFLNTAMQYKGNE